MSIWSHHSRNDNFNDGYHDAERGRKDHDRYDPYDGEARREYARGFDSRERDERREREERQEQEEQEAQEERRRHHERQMERQQEEEQYYQEMQQQQPEPSVEQQGEISDERTH